MSYSPHKYRVPKPRRANTEHQLQADCVRWFRYSYPKFRLLLFAIPNGAELKNGAKAWGKLQAEGAVAGAADLFLSVPVGELAGLYIEMKTPKGRQTKTQKEFEAAVVAQGYGYAVPRSSLEFEKVVQCYLGTGEYDHMKARPDGPDTTGKETGYEGPDEI